MDQQLNVVELCPVAPGKVAKYFTQILVSDTFTIPEQKPDKEQIINVSRDITLADVQTISVDLPDPGVDGNKIFAAGNVYLGVQYSADRPSQTVHYVRFQLPFQAVIVGDCGNLIPSTDTIFGPNSYVVHVCVEKMEYQQIDKRIIFFELLLLVWVEEVVAP
ncbi:MAG: hypothetical protein XD78_1775 [Desulfotomaculum sp. 46_296]|nr:MAG: hypothetical protein XD78_1775 [Desulfotomaculum sp. 46_296]HAU32376.1 hypothetical protein [Desulfotomaculum sp.]